ncbi:MAG: metal ABC transporter permease [Myxococcales bacterium]|nr:metal ABC transporter permease [Myxococcales bacterium]
MTYEQWVIVAVGACVGAGCALIGAFLVLRKIAMLGDAISHAVLPGIAIAFLLSGSRATLPMVIGAGIFGVLTVVLVGALSRTRRINEDASIGVVFPALFSVGVILISKYAAGVDLDLDCVLFGEIAYSALDTLRVGGASLGPRPLWITGGILLVNLVVVLVFFKELKLTSFDPELAAAIGISPVVMHYVLMSAVSVTVVGSFESVGAILVVAMLIVPPATAYLLTNSLAMMLVLSALCGAASAVGGYAVSAWLDCSVAGAMATVSGLMFVVALVLSPRYGLVAQAWARALLGRRMREQLVLLHLGSASAQHGTAAAELAQRFRWRAAQAERLLGGLERRKQVERVGDGWRLTSYGTEAIERAGKDVLRHADEDGGGAA